MSRIQVTIQPTQWQPRIDGWFPLYRRSIDHLYWTKVVNIFETHLNGDGTNTYRIDAVCQAMSENDQAMCVVPVYDYEAKKWGNLEEIVPPEPKQVEVA